MASYRDSMSAVIAEQISAAFRNLNVTQSVRGTRDDPRYGEEVLGVGNMEPVHPSVGRRLIAQIEYATLSRTGALNSLDHPMTFLSKTLYFESIA